MDRSRIVHEQKYREYRLLDLVVKPRDPDLYEYAFLHGYLDRCGNEETRSLLSACLQKRWEALGWHFHRSWCGSPEDVDKRLRDLKLFEEKARRGNRRNIPEKALAFLDLLGQGEEISGPVFEKAGEMYAPFMPGAEKSDGRHLPREALTDSGDQGEEVRLLIDGHVIWNLSVQADYPLETWQIGSVTLLPGFTIIDQNAFAFCINLRRAVLPDTLAQAGYGAFALCFSLDDVVISESCRDRIFPLQRLSQGPYIQIGHPAFEHLGWLSPRDIHDRDYMLGHNALTNDSDYLKSPWYAERIKGQIVHNLYKDPRYPRAPLVIEKIRRRLPVPRETVICPACMTPYERELRIPFSECPFCGQRLTEDSRSPKTLIDRLYDLPPEAYIKPEEEKEGEPLLSWRAALRLLVTRACDPLQTQIELGEYGNVTGEKKEKGRILFRTLSGDDRGRGSLPPHFADPGRSFSMILGEEKKKKSGISEDKLFRRKKHYGYDAEAFDAVFAKEILPLYAAAAREGWHLGRVDWIYEKKETLRSFSLLTEYLPEPEEGRRKLGRGPLAFLTGRE
ncbi:MAG: leucine-rich repeat protein [bacterium]